MDLYEIVPEYLFSVLVSKNKRLYVHYTKSCGKSNRYFKFFDKDA